MPSPRTCSPSPPKSHACSKPANPRRPSPITPHCPAASPRKSVQKRRGSEPNSTPAAARLARIAFSNSKPSHGTDSTRSRSRFGRLSLKCRWRFSDGHRSRARQSVATFDSRVPKWVNSSAKRSAELAARTSRCAHPKQYAIFDSQRNCLITKLTTNLFYNTFASLKYEESTTRLLHGSPDGARRFVVSG